MKSIMLLLPCFILLTSCDDSEFKIINDHVYLHRTGFFLSTYEHDPNCAACKRIGRRCEDKNEN